MKTIRDCVYYCGGKVIREEPMKFSRMHAAGEDMVIDSVGYTAAAIAIHGTTQPIYLIKGHFYA